MLKYPKIKNFFSKLINGMPVAYFAALMSVINLLFFYFPFFNFVLNNVNLSSLNGIVIFISLIVAVLVANFFAFYLICFLLRFVGKMIIALSFIISSLAIYFIVTYNVILDESMIGNVFNTDYDEAMSFFSFKMVLYVVLFGLLPCFYIFRAKLNYGTWKRFVTTASLTVGLILVVVFANAGNWLWIDKYAKELGGLVMPWSYTVNTVRYQMQKHQKNKVEILLPDAIIGNDEKDVVVLVIGESARRHNFSLYGYEKPTNPLLEGDSVYVFDATSCTTYTTGSLKCILEHEDTGELYEILPNYLYRNGIEVIWRTTNWGEPPLHIKHYQVRQDLMQICQGDDCEYDEVLLTDLEKQITANGNNKVLVVLHTSTSHGPQYSKKYPPRFEVFTPVCNSVELANCTRDELMNAYDNTIVYTDYILHQIIDILKQMNDYNSMLLFVSDHGESLGEKNLYMHGAPISIAPKEQYEIPFIVWLSDNSRRLKPNKELTQHHVFHSVLDFLGVQSPVYNSKLSIFEPNSDMQDKP